MDETGIDWERQYRNLESQLETMMLSIAKRMDVLEREGNRAGRIHGVSHRYELGGAITCVNVAFVEDPEFAWYVYRPDGVVDKVAYSRSNTLNYVPKETGDYRISAYVRTAGKKDSVLVKSTGKVVVSVLGGLK